jgi:hypothetical protein
MMGIAGGASHEYSGSNQKYNQSRFHIFPQGFYGFAPRLR